MFDRIIYRLRQLRFGLTASMSAADKEFARESLDIKEQALFNALPEYEQKHAVVVARRMVEEFHKNPQLDKHLLAKVGLLHDIGKAAVRLSIFDKGSLVVLSRVAPLLYDYFAERGRKEDSFRLFRKFFVYKHHGEIGAEMLRRVGEREEVLTCVAAHDIQKFQNDKYLKFLQEADNTI